MIPRIHGFGSSFKGIGQYLLHDKGHANTNERVAFTYTHNIGTNDAATAFRVQAATAIAQKELKRQSHEQGQAALPAEQQTAFRNSGRKLTQSVMHYTLSWHPDEAADLTPEEMVQAGVDSLSVMGQDKTKSRKRAQFGHEHQAVFVCHDDTKHKHLHVVVNRVHPDHGHALPSYKDYERLSKWAEEYERSRNQVYCPQRIVNNRERANVREGFRVYGQGHLPHHIVQARKVARPAANDNAEAFAAMEAEQKRKNALLAERGRNMAAKHKSERKALVEGLNSRRRAIKDDAVKSIGAVRVRQHSAFKAREVALQQSFMDKLNDLDKAEESRFGAAKGIWEGVKSTWRRGRVDGEAVKLSDYHNIFAGHSARVDAFQKEQQALRSKLDAEKNQAIKSDISKIEQQRKYRLHEARYSYVSQKAAMQSAHSQDSQELRRAWKERTASQIRSYKDPKIVEAYKLKHRENFNQAAAASSQISEGKQTGHTERQDDLETYRARRPVPQRSSERSPDRKR